MIGYSDAIVNTHDRPLIVRSNVALATELLQYHSCGVNFIIRLHLIPLISGQRAEKFSRKVLHGPTKHYQSKTSRESRCRGARPSRRTHGCHWRCRAADWGSSLPFFFDEPTGGKMPTWTWIQSEVAEAAKFTSGHLYFGASAGHLFLLWKYLFRVKLNILY